MESDSWDNDENAYTINFSVSEIEPLNEKDLEKATITVELNY